MLRRAAGRYSGDRPSKGKPLISHHRGGIELDTHGSIGAYRAAIDSGADLIEFDVWRSSDGVFFCSHEERTADGTRLCDLRWAEIRRRYPDVPGYEELLAAANGRSICHIDLKQRGDEDQITELARRHLSDITSDAIFTSLEHRSVRRIRAIDPDLKVALSLGRDMEGRGRIVVLWTRVGEIIPFARLMWCRANAVAVNYRLLTKGLLIFCRMTDRTVMVWTVNDDGMLRRLLGMDGVDVIITDRPLRATELRDSS